MKKFGLILAAFFLAAVTTTNVRAERIYGITGASSASASVGVNLVYFDSATPGTVTTVGALSGVTAGQGIKSIDFRPGSTTLYAISTAAAGGSAAQLYRCNITTAVCSPLGGAITLGTNTSNRTEIEYDPVANNLRVITGAASTQTNNFRFNATTGAAIATDTNLLINPSDPNSPYTGFSMIAGAYSNNTVGAASTQLFLYDYATDAIFSLTNPNNGIFDTRDVPADFLTGNASVGMDYSGATNTLYVTHDDPDTGTFMGLFTRNPTAGLGDEISIGPYPSGTFIIDISVLPAVTAAGVGINGRVFASEEGRGLVGARVIITDQNGQSRFVLTGKGGSFTFDDLELGQTYIVKVLSRTQTFQPQVVQMNDNVTALNFIPE